MTVKQLIEELKKHNPNMNVLIESRDATDYMCKSSIESVEEGHPYNEDGYSGIDDTEMDEMEFDENDEYVGIPVLLINVGMV
jgi:hypothetical protein